MKHTWNFLGFDFGASSGRAMLGVFDGERVELRELHRSTSRWSWRGALPGTCRGCSLR